MLYAFASMCYLEKAENDNLGRNAFLMDAMIGLMSSGPACNMSWGSATSASAGWVGGKSRHFSGHGLDPNKTKWVFMVEFSREYAQYAHSLQCSHCPTYGFHIISRFFFCFGVIVWEMQTGPGDDRAASFQVLPLDLNLNLVFS